MASFLDQVCPMLLTYNEEPNMDRTLSRLKWAKEILLIDSFSTDGTLEIARRYPQVRVVQRKFDTFAQQCNFGLSQATLPWVLSMDADYVLTKEIVEEMGRLPENPPPDGYEAAFIYCIYGRRLRGTLYPPRKVLYRREKARYEDDGHAHHVAIGGQVGRLRGKILHDDRKPLGRWLASQNSYALREAEKYRQAPRSQLGTTDRLRQRRILVPFLAIIYTLFWKGLILDGLPGFYYAFQRVIAEMILGLRLMEDAWLEEDRKDE